MGKSEKEFELRGQRWMANSMLQNTTDMSSIYSPHEFEKLFLEAHKQRGTIAALEDEATRLKASLSNEQRARAKAVIL